MVKHRSGTRWPDGREVGWRCMRSTPCTRRRGAHVFWLSLKTKVDGLSVVWPQNHYDGLSVVWSQNYWDSLSVVWPQNYWDSFFRFGLKTGGYGFTSFGLKTGGNGLSQFVLKTGGFRFSGLGLKTDSYNLVIWVSKSPWSFLGLSLKTKWVRFVGCATKPMRDEDGVGHVSRSSSFLHL
jgi:hypothetical protein